MGIMESMALISRLKRFLYGLSVADAGSRRLHRSEFTCFNGACAVNRLADGVYYAADHGLAHWHGHDFSGAFYSLSFTDPLVGSE